MTENRITGPLDTEAWDESLAEVIDDMAGQPINVHKLMANHPALLRAWWNLRNYTIAGGDLGQRHTELLILRVALKMENWYEWASHVHRGLAAGLTMEEIERVKAGPADPDWQPDERLLIQAVDELVHDRAVTDATLEALREYFTDRQILDAIVTQGAYVTLGCLLNTWETPLDEHVEAAIPDDVTREGFPRK
jgi:alkylhydroperoxidase family enzyme